MARCLLLHPQAPNPLPQAPNRLPQAPSPLLQALNHLKLAQISLPVALEDLHEIPLSKEDLLKTIRLALFHPKMIL